MINQDSADLDIQQQGFDFQKFFDKKYTNQEPQKDEVHKSNQPESQQHCQGDTLRALVKNIKIEKQVAGRNKKNKKIQWNEKNTMIFKDLYYNQIKIILYYNNIQEIWIKSFYTFNKIMNQIQKSILNKLKINLKLKRKKKT